MKNNKKMIIGILVTSLLISAASFSYALWERYFTQSGENTISTTKCFNVTYTGGSDVKLTNVAPVTDEDGRNTTPYEVTIKNNCDTTVTYNVILNKNKSSDLDDTHVKVTTGANIQLLSNTEKVTTNTSLNGLSNYTDGTSNIIGTGYSLPNETKKIKVKIWLDNDTTPTEGQNKTFNYKVTVEATETNKEPTVTILGKEYKVHTEKPDFVKGFPNTETTEEDKTNQSGLYQSYDDDGDTYYFRGAVTDNYVEFAEKTWRILRINGDGTIRLILDNFAIESQVFNASPSGDYHQYVGYTRENDLPCTKTSPCKSTYNSLSNTFTMTPSGTPSDMKTYLEQWYIDNLKTYDSKIAITTFCNDVSYYKKAYYSSGEDPKYYGPDGRGWTNHKPVLECPNPKNNDGTMEYYGGVYKLKIGLINTDELNMGGFGSDIGNLDATEENFLRRSKPYWTLSPFYASSSVGGMFQAQKDGGFSQNPVSSHYAVVPVINLKTGTLTSSGNGTSSSPFKIN